MFRRDLDEAEILTYMEGLRDLPLDRIENACQKALFTLKRMPMLADLRELVKEQGIEARMDRGSRDHGPSKYCAACYPDGWKKVERVDMPGYFFVARCDCQSKTVRG